MDGTCGHRSSFCLSVTVVVVWPASTSSLSFYPYVPTSFRSNRKDQLSVISSLASRSPLKQASKQRIMFDRGPVKKVVSMSFKTTGTTPCRRHPTMPTRWVMIMAAVCVLLFMMTSSVTANEESTMTTTTTKKKKKKGGANNILQGHVYINSVDASKSHTNGRVEISEPRARIMADEWPIRYYSGNIRYHMHVAMNPRSLRNANSGDSDDEDDDEEDEGDAGDDTDEYFIFEAWRGAESSDGTVLQIFQLTGGASWERIAETLYDYGGSANSQKTEPFCGLALSNIRQFLNEMARQKEARVVGGLQGLEVYLNALKRQHRDGISYPEARAAEKQAQTILAEDAGNWVVPPVRLRTATLSLSTGPPSDNNTPPATESFFYVIVEEDSGLGYLYDNSIGWIARMIFGDADYESWAYAWGRRAIYKFLPTTKPFSLQLGIRAYHSGKTDVRRLDKLLVQAWGVPNITSSSESNNATSSTETAETPSSETSSENEDASTETATISSSQEAENEATPKEDEL